MSDAIIVKKEMCDIFPDGSDLLPTLNQISYPYPYMDALTMKKSMSLSCSPIESCSSRSSDPSSYRSGGQPTHCIMCYRKANVLHYGVPSCATCKTFFRRSLMSEREIHCRKNAECAKPLEYWSDPSIARNLRQCSWCRLARFVSLGMNPCAVIPRDGRELLEYPNFAKLLGASRNLQGHSTLHTSEAYRATVIAPQCENLSRTFWRIRRCDSKHRQLRTSDFSPKPRDRFNWGLAEYIWSPVEMDREIQELVWAKSGPAKQPPSAYIKEEIEEDSEDNEVPVKSNSRRRKLPLFALQKNWTFADSICAIEYVKFFHATFELGFDLNDQISILRGSVIQLSIIEMAHFSWKAGFDRLTYPDGTRPSSKHFDHSISHSDSLISKIASLSLTRSELAIMKALLVCKADGISARSREALDEITLHLSKILSSVCLCKYEQTSGIARMTAIIDLFQVVENQKSREAQGHVIEHLNKIEPKVMQNLFYCD